MWYFLVRQDAIRKGPYQTLLQLAAQTEIEPFNEPYHNWCIFQVERDQYLPFTDYLDMAGIRYDTFTARPTRDQLLASMR